MGVAKYRSSTVFIAAPSAAAEATTLRSQSNTIYPTTAWQGQHCWRCCCCCCFSSIEVSRYILWHGAHSRVTGGFNRKQSAPAPSRQWWWWQEQWCSKTRVWSHWVTRKNTHSEATVEAAHDSSAACCTSIKWNLGDSSRAEWPVSRRLQLRTARVGAR